MKPKIYYLFILTAVLAAFSCNRLKISDNPSYQLEFSVDTLFMDTVFTTVGSATYRFMVYNNNPDDIEISSIKIKDNQFANFRLNVDGEFGASFSNIPIRANDSIFVFAEVTVDPNNGTTPMVLEDAVQFETNTNQQEVVLVAWGQDAYFYRNAITTSSTTLPNDKPHVIYGILAVDSSHTLTLLPGTQLHFHANSALLALNSASIQAVGTVEEPIVFQGDRLEFEYKDDPGQWYGIVLSATSINNEFTHCEIKNANIGLRIDSVGNANPSLTLKNTTIKNMAGIGLLARGAHVYAENCEFSTAGQYVVAAIYGGDYTFNHCTFANYWRFGSRPTGLLLLNNYYQTATGDLEIRDLNTAYFGNCIIAGSNTNELEIDLNDQGASNYFFEHCILKTDETVTDPNHFNSITTQMPDIIVDGETRNAIFTNPTEYDFTLFDLSIARNKGTATTPPFLPADKLENARSSSAVDLGAYTFVE